MYHAPCPMRPPPTGAPTLHTAHAHSHSYCPQATAHKSTNCICGKIGAPLQGALWGLREKSCENPHDLPTVQQASPHHLSVECRLVCVQSIRVYPAQCAIREKSVVSVNSVFYPSPTKKGMYHMAHPFHYSTKVDYLLIWS